MKDINSYTKGLEFCALSPKKKSVTVSLPLECVTKIAENDVKITAVLSILLADYVFGGGEHPPEESKEEPKRNAQGETELEEKMREKTKYIPIIEEFMDMGYSREEAVKQRAGALAQQAAIV